MWRLLLCPEEVFVVMEPPHSAFFFSDERLLSCSGTTRMVLAELQHVVYYLHLLDWSLSRETV